jgi:peptidoglycan hydrolase-like protein with peptidoglycan-binding domain
MLMAAIDRACEQQPRASFHAMVNQLAASLRRNAITAKTELVPIQNDSIGMVLYAETLRRLQAALRQKGFVGVDVTGAFDAPTRRALTDFQKQRGLAPTGVPDQPTLASLLP